MHTCMHAPSPTVRVRAWTLPSINLPLSHTHSTKPTNQPPNNIQTGGRPVRRPARHPRPHAGTSHSATPYHSFVCPFPLAFVCQRSVGVCVTVPLVSAPPCARALIHPILQHKPRTPACMHAHRRWASSAGRCHGPRPAPSSTGACAGAWPSSTCGRRYVKCD